jgi:hypothetical protein
VRVREQPAHSEAKQGYTHLHGSHLSRQRIYNSTL